MAVHFVVAPLPAPDRARFPRAGDRFASRVEGFEQQVLAVDARDLVTLRTTLAPGAAGPPRHRHQRFVERFAVRSGVLSLELGDRRLQLRAGERIEIAPGVAHRPFNETREPVVLEGEAVMPLSFAACLAQIYPILDGDPRARGRSMLLQTTVMDRSCDTHIDAMPSAVESLLRALVGPWARLAGYRSDYPELSLHR